MTSNSKLYGCPVELSLDLLGGKWKTVILARIKQKPMRYGELRRLIPSLSEKMLTQRLHELEEAGFVARRGDPTPRYALTERGRSLQPALTALYDWGQREAAASGARLRPSIMTDRDGQEESE